MKESVAIAKDADAKKDFSSTRSDNSIHRVRNEPEKQLGSLRSVIANIRHDGGTPSLDSIATELSSMHTAQRASVLLALQRTHGNRYVQRVVAGIQAKLVVGQPGDKYEQEADRVADEVMRMPEPEVQRQEEEEEEPVQAKGQSGQTTEVTSDLESSIQALRGSGQPLRESVRNFFEPRFGYDFSQVRVHTGSEAGEMNRDLNAQAFTYGRDIYFGAGQYNPGTSSGKRLLAHELTHVLQKKVGLQCKPKEGSSPVSQAIESAESSARIEKLIHISETAEWALKAVEILEMLEWIELPATVAAPIAMAGVVFGPILLLLNIGKKAEQAHAGDRLMGVKVGLKAAKRYVSENKDQPWSMNATNLLKLATADQEWKDHLRFPVYSMLDYMKLGVTDISALMTELMQPFNREVRKLLKASTMRIPDETINKLIATIDCGLVLYYADQMLEEVDRFREKMYRKISGKD